MARIDTIEKLPTVFKQKQLLSFTYRQERIMLIVKGIGYHKLEPTIGKPITYSTSIQVPSSVLGIENENAYLEYANSCGLLEKITATNYFFLTFTKRRTTQVRAYSE